MLLRACAPALAALICSYPIAAPALDPSNPLAPRLKQLEQALEDHGIHVNADTSAIVLSGFVDAGYTYGFSGSRAESWANAPSRGDFQLFQGHLNIEKGLPDRVASAAGFRIDLRWGEDFSGTESGDISVNQAYAQWRIPVGNGLGLMIGKWEGLIGYEDTGRLNIPNITPSLQAVLFEPGTHTGLLMSYPLADQLTAMVGVANGWNNDDGSFAGLEVNKDPVDPVLLTGSVSWENPEGNAMLFAAVAVSSHGEPALGPEYVVADQIWIANHFGEWRPVFADDRLMLAYNLEAGAIAGARPFDGGVSGASRTSSFWGASLYTSYDVTDWIAVAGRLEYVHSDDGAVPNGPLFGESYSDPWQNHAGFYDLGSATFTLSLDACEDLVLRVEYRVDWGNETITSGAASSEGPSHMLAAEVAYRF